MVRSLDHDVSSFIAQLERSVEQSRDVYKQLEAKLMILTDQDWEDVQLKAVERCNTDCPICLNPLQSKSLLDKSTTSSRKGSRKNGMRRETVLLSCSHVFHNTCLVAFEEFAEGDKRFACPVCRSHYQKKILWCVFCFYSVFITYLPVWFHSIWEVELST